MKKHHVKGMRSHALFSVSLAIIFCVVILVRPDTTFAATALAVLIYVTGNGLIHTKKNTLSRDILLEYLFISLIIFVLLVSILLQK